MFSIMKSMFGTSYIPTMSDIKPTAKPYARFTITVDGYNDYRVRPGKFERMSARIEFLNKTYANATQAEEAVVRYLETEKKDAQKVVKRFY